MRSFAAALGMVILFHAVSVSAALAPGKRPSKQYTIEQFLATTTVGGPSFSPDGSKVLFTSDASGLPNVYTVPSDGGPITPLTRSTTESTYAVSYFPKDERVLYTH